MFNKNKINKKNQNKVIKHNTKIKNKKKKYLSQKYKNKIMITHRIKMMTKMIQIKIYLKIILNNKILKIIKNKIHSTKKNYLNKMISKLITTFKKNLET